MIIDEDILFENGAVLQNYLAGEPIFNENTIPKFFYQIRTGMVKLTTYREDGTEFIHSLPSDGHAFAESFLYDDELYCINAVAVTDTQIIKLPKFNFISLMNSRNDLLQKIVANISERMFYRHKMLTMLSINKPSYRIMKILNLLKQHHQIEMNEEFTVPLSRQQIASLTGLRVETVIRTVKKLEKENKLKISQGKILL